MALATLAPENRNLIDGELVDASNGACFENVNVRTETLRHLHCETLFLHAIILWIQSSWITVWKVPHVNGTCPVSANNSVRSRAWYLSEVETMNWS